MRLKVKKSCPYYEDGHKYAEVQLDDQGRVSGILGPHDELYTRIDLD